MKEAIPNPSFLRRVKDLFVCGGRLRTGWALILVLIACVFAQWLGAWGFSALTQKLFALWGVTEKSVSYAPQWLQTAIGCYGSLEAAAQGLCGLAAAWLGARFLLGQRLPGRIRHIFTGAGIGFALSALAFALLRLTDSVRTMPSGGMSPLAEVLSLLGALGSALAPEALLGGIVFALAAPHANISLQKGLLFVAFALLNALLYALSCPWTPAALASLLCMSAACAMLYARQSWLGAVALRCFWSFSAHRIFGFSSTGLTGMFFETYPVSRDWLTGGDYGLESGWLCALLFAAATWCIYRIFRNGGRNDA